MQPEVELFDSLFLTHDPVFDTCHIQNISTLILFFISKNLRFPYVIFIYYISSYHSQGCRHFLDEIYSSSS